MMVFQLFDLLKPETRNLGRRTNMVGSILIILGCIMAACAQTQWQSFRKHYVSLKGHQEINRVEDVLEEISFQLERLCLVMKEESSREAFDRLGVQRVIETHISFAQTQADLIGSLNELQKTDPFKGRKKIREFSQKNIPELKRRLDFLKNIADDFESGKFAK